MMRRKNAWLAVAALAFVSITGAMGVAKALGSVAGVWSTTWGSEVCTLTLQQNGASVVGTYETTGAPPGRVAGTMQGNVLVGQWTDAGGGVGGMRLTFANDARSFTGTWGSGSSDSDGGGWDGRR